MPFDYGTPEKQITGATVLLLRAAEIIKSPKRWSVGAQQRWRFWHMQYCATGSVRRAAELFDLAEEDEALAALNQTAKTYGFKDAAAMNDHPDTTHGMIVALLREAAELTKTSPQPSRETDNAV